MVHVAHDPPAFYPEAFKLLAGNILYFLNLTQEQITAKNCKCVYLYLSYVFSNVIYFHCGDEILS